MLLLPEGADNDIVFLRNDGVTPEGSTIQYFSENAWLVMVPVVAVVAFLHSRNRRKCEVFGANNRFRNGRAREQGQ